ncbi:MAG: hypothetical protein AAF985_27775, partial [Bacteroidota bacterium]
MEAKYTEALERYEEILNEGTASPAMLLKMAYIEDGLENFASSLFYLNAYFQKTGDRATLTKIEELAANNKLVGYNYSDIDIFFIFFKKYRHQIVLILLLLA